MDVCPCLWVGQGVGYQPTLEPTWVWVAEIVFLKAEIWGPSFIQLFLPPPGHKPTQSHFYPFSLNLKA